jgi:hypothetical protein
VQGKAHRTVRVARRRDSRRLPGQDGGLIEVKHRAAQFPAPEQRVGQTVQAGRVVGVVRLGAKAPSII